MARAAGDSPYYTFYLNGDTEGPAIALPSVTTIIKKVIGAGPGVIAWAYKRGTDGLSSPAEYRQERAEEGTSAHGYLEASVAEGEPLHPDTAFEAAIADWLDAHMGEIAESEAAVFSLEHRFAGTLDLVLKTDSGLRVVDLKTRKAGTRKAYETDLIQTAAYALAYEEMTGIPVTDTAVLLALDNGKYVYDERTVDRQLFLDVLAVYRGLERNGL